MSASQSLKRTLSPPSSRERQWKDHRRHQNQESPLHYEDQNPQKRSFRTRNDEEEFAREQTRRNQAQEAEQMRAWVAKEDDFVLNQSKKKAQIRVKEGRARVIDWLAVTLRVIDDTEDHLEDEGDGAYMEVIDPAGVFESLNLKELQDLDRDIDTYLSLEKHLDNRKYWNALKIICRDHQARLAPAQVRGRTNASILAEVDRLLGPKTLAELVALENQISNKLESNEPIDVEYWEQLLQSVGVYKAKGDLKAIYKSVIESRLDTYRKEQQAEATKLEARLKLLLGGHDRRDDGAPNQSLAQSVGGAQLGNQVKHSQHLDPEPELKLRVEDKNLEVTDEEDFLDRLKAERQRVINLRYVPPKTASSSKRLATQPITSINPSITSSGRIAVPAQEDFSSATKALYEREVARGVQEDEEIFAGEEDVSTKSQPQWSGKYRPRKPRYFNRVQMGYEWNKYNQTHYDHSNPPPKVVQGYKFNIFYPDLIEKARAPTYRIEREGGRKRGETFAPAGEEDTCLIRFISGPPYEDLAFRIVDKEWDYSAKRERGFRSSFDKGILQLHFQFKKVGASCVYCCHSAHLTSNRSITESEDRLTLEVEKKKD